MDIQGIVWVIAILQFVVSILISNWRKPGQFETTFHIAQVSFLFFLLNRRADVERGLLMEGAELLEPLLSSKLSKVGISRFVVAREWAKVLRAEGVIRINNCFSAATGLSQHQTFFNLILLLILVHLPLKEGKLLQS
jgi:hypothetical protein